MLSLQTPAAVNGVASALMTPKAPLIVTKSFPFIIETCFFVVFFLFFGPCRDAIITLGERNPTPSVLTHCCIRLLTLWSALSVRVQQAVINIYPVQSKSHYIQPLSGSFAVIPPVQLIRFNEMV